MHITTEARWHWYERNFVGHQWSSSFRSLYWPQSHLTLLSPLSHFMFQYFYHVWGHAQWSREQQSLEKHLKSCQATALPLPPNICFLPLLHPSPIKQNMVGINAGAKTEKGSKKQVIETRKDGRTVDTGLNWCFVWCNLLSSSNWMLLQLSRWDTPTKIWFQIHNSTLLNHFLY